MARIEADRISRRDGSSLILDDVSFDVADGEFVGLIGPSGSGKTSIIRAIAGFDPLDKGTVRFDGRDMTLVPTRERDIGMVSQNNTLFPTHRVRSNLRFPLLMRALDRAEIRKRVEAESRAHNIDHILERWPDSLSGGEQQLAQIARALVRAPQVFLMDEPLSQLDVRIRRHMRQEIVALQEGYDVTIIYASNRPEEIMSMPQRLIALDDGRVVQTGTPAEVRARPATLALAELTGAIGKLSVTVEADDTGYRIAGPGIALRAWAPLLADQVGRPMRLAARTNDVRVQSSGPITMTVARPTFHESKPATQLRSDAGALHTYDTDLAPNTTVELTLDRWLLYDGDGQLVFSFPS